MENYEKSNQNRIVPGQDLSIRSKVYIHIELGCEKVKLEDNLRLLLEELYKTRDKTNEFYDITRPPLMKLLKTAIGKIEGKDVKESIQIEKLPPFDGWGCSMTLATYDQPHLSPENG